MQKRYAKTHASPLTRKFILSDEPHASDVVEFPSVIRRDVPGDTSGQATRGSVARSKRVFFSDLTLEPLQYLIRSLFRFHL